MVEGVHEDEEGDFKDESLGRDGVNLFGKAGGELAESRFDGFAKVPKQEIFVRRVRLGAVALSGGLLPIAGCFGEQVFPGVVRVTGVGVEHAALGQVRGQVPQAGNVGFRAGMDVKVHGDAGGGGHDLRLKAVKPQALARA